MDTTNKHTGHHDTAPTPNAAAIVKFADMKDEFPTAFHMAIAENMPAIVIWEQMLGLSL